MPRDIHSQTLDLAFPLSFTCLSAHFSSLSTLIWMAAHVSGPSDTSTSFVSPRVCPSIQHPGGTGQPTAPNQHLPMDAHSGLRTLLFQWQLLQWALGIVPCDTLSPSPSAYAEFLSSSCATFCMNCCIKCCACSSWLTQSPFHDLLSPHFGHLITSSKQKFPNLYSTLSHILCMFTEKWAQANLLLLILSLLFCTCMHNVLRTG